MIMQWLVSDPARALQLYALSLPTHTHTHALLLPCAPVHSNTSEGIHMNDLKEVWL